MSNHSIGNKYYGWRHYFYNGVKNKYLCEKSYVLNFLRGRCDIGTSGRTCYGGTLWIIHSEVLLFILHKFIFLQIYFHGNEFWIHTSY